MKQYLPSRALKADYLRIYWAEVPQHVNFTNNLLRQKINSVAQAAADKYSCFKILKMKKFWDADNTNLFRNNRFSGKGLAKYWASVDAAFQYNETWKSSIRPGRMNQMQYHKTQADRYHWTSGKAFKGDCRHHCSENELRFKLPKLTY